jgi:hypothetical protein
MNIPETLKMPSLSGLGKRLQGILRNQSTRGFFDVGFSFQNCFFESFSHIWFVSILENKKCLEASKSILNEYSDPML